MSLQRRVNVKRILLAGFLSGSVIAVIYFLFQYIVQSVLPYDVLKLGGMRSQGDPIMALFFLYPWVVGFTMTAVYRFFTKLIQCRKCKPIIFAVVVWLVSAVPQFFIVVSSMDYPLGFYVNQLFGSFFYMLAAAYVIWKILD
ncbi:MAG: hypothetical protein JW778_06085 [Candidatus Altiarchaeota archaeon]|nr:hypothetical protein [Candidatus Altiarchaeota archaeon]